MSVGEIITNINTKGHKIIPRPLQKKKKKLASRKAGIIVEV